MSKIVFYILFILFVGMSSGNMTAVFKAMLVPLGIEVMIFSFHSFIKWKQNVEVTRPSWYVKLKNFNDTKLTWYRKGD